MVEFARNGDVEIAFADLGGAGGDPLLLVMGLGVSRAWWPPGFVEELVGRGFHVVAYDQRDSGRSTRLPDAEAVHPAVALFRPKPGPYTAEDMTDDAVAVMDAVGWPAAHLFGHSMGGLIAQRIALRHPGRTLSMTSVAAMPSDAGPLRLLRYLRPGTIVKMSRIRFPEGHDGDVAAGVALARIIASPGYPFDEDAARATVERDLDQGGSGVRDTRAQSRQTAARWSGGRLADMRVPALVLHGDRDQIGRPAAGRDTAAAIPGARLVLLPGVGHDLPAGVWPRVVDEVRALADRAAVSRGAPGKPRSGQ